jgi:hypothetical protein
LSAKEVVDLAEQFLSEAKQYLEGIRDETMSQIITRPNIKEMVPEEGQFQFKASELRKLPKVSEGFLTKRLEPEIFECESRSLH